MTLYVDKPADGNGCMKRLQSRLLQFLDSETANGAEYPGIQGATFTVAGFSPETGEDCEFVVRFDNHWIIGTV